MKTIIAIIFAGMVIIGVEKMFFSTSEDTTQCMALSSETTENTLLSCAEAGYAEAQYFIFKHFEYDTKGYDTPETEAINWLREAEKKGHIEAKLRLMWLYSGGFKQKYESIPRSYDKSYALARELAFMGVPRGQYFYGAHAILRKRGLSSMVLGTRWVIEAANNGDELAMDRIREQGGTGTKHYLKAMALEEAEWRN